jgi:CRP/FNR family transcriptional regulator, cyclic AMP receptor protein
MKEADLSIIPLFADMPRAQLQQLNGLAHQRSYRAGEQVFRQGEDGIGVFVVTGGEFELLHELPNGESQVELTVGPGAVLGLTSMLDEGPRRASARAITDGSCMVLTRMTFRQAIAANPAIAINIMRGMARNLREISALLDRD